jgi:type I restriction enzyme S subunit
MSNSQDFPQNWNSVDLAKVAQVIDPHPSHRAPDEEMDGIPFAGIGDLNDQGELVTDSVRSVSQHVLVEHAIRYTLSGNSIGFGRVASIGKVINFQDDVSGIAISPTMAVVEPKSIDRNYLIHALQSNFLKEQIERLLTGTTRSSLGIELLRKLRIPIPVDREPEQIGLILTTLDTAIRRTEALIAKYQQIKAGLMHDLFTRGVTPDGHLRLVSEGQRTKFGWIPKDWRIGSLLDVADQIRQPILTGPFGADMGSDDFVPEGVPVLRIGNVQQGRLDLSDLLYVSEVKARQLQRYKVNEGDLLFARQGATTGRNALASRDVQGYLINYHIIRVALDHSRCAPLFIEAAFAGEIVKRQVERDKGRGTREGINTAQLKALELPLASVDEQRSIARILMTHTALCTEIQSQLVNLRKQKHGLMQDLLTGRVRVKVGEPAST